MTIGWPAAAARSAPSRNPSRFASTTSSRVMPAFRGQLRRVADLRVGDAVGGEVLGALGGDPDDRVALLQDADGVRERLEVELERLAVGAAPDTRRRARRGRVVGSPS